MLEAHGVTHQGLVRPTNEDGLVHDADLGLFVVADGMGGHSAGEVASRLALESVHTFIRRTKDDEEFTWPFGVDLRLSFDANRVRTALRLANRRAFQVSESGAEFAGMGTTLVTVLITGSRLTYAAVGDSRLYSVRDRALSRLTEDDSWIATLRAREPDLDEEQLKRHPLRHVITKAIGMLADTDVEIHERTLIAGEVLLLCTDGLHDMVSDREIQEVLAERASLQASADRLLAQALERGGRDNVTALLVRYDG
ncbi:MAG: SpoIIE family protein phosphatase [Luteitalea sp.]|nr:SpoIIE family protein phosphatase [Luteitalea sp.]